MYYKLLNGDIVIDILNKITYIRYLPKAQKWIQSGPSVAHGVMGSNQNTIYLLEESNCAYETTLPRIRVVEIEENEYFRLANEIALQQKEKAELNARIDALEATLAQQTSLLEQLLAKLS